MKASLPLAAGLLAAGILVGFFFSGSFVPTGLLTLSENVSFSSLRVTFCPSPECTTLPISVLDAAQNRIHVAMYSFTNEDFSDALIRAHERGVDVKVVVEKQQAGSQYSQHAALADAGVPVRIDTNPNLMHHKFAVIDGEKTITGSMNWTGNGVGENNENELVLNSPEANNQFEEEFEKIWEESQPYAGG